MALSAVPALFPMSDPRRQIGQGRPNAIKKVKRPDTERDVYHQFEHFSYLSIAAKERRIPDLHAA